VLVWVVTVVTVVTAAPRLLLLLLLLQFVLLTAWCLDLGRGASISASVYTDCVYMRSVSVVVVVVVVVVWVVAVVVVVVVWVVAVVVVVAGVVWRRIGDSCKCPASRCEPCIFGIEHITVNSDQERGSAGLSMADDKMVVILWPEKPVTEL